MFNISRLFCVLTFFTFCFICESVQAQKINQFNNNKKRTGVWKKYYPNKRIRYEGQFKDGREIGVFKFYDITNSSHPVTIKTFYENSDSLLVQFYSLKGKLESEGIVKDKKRQGNWKYFFSDGKVMSEEQYVNGKLNGKFVVYYPNGKITELSYYKNGLLHGLSSKFSSKGVLIEEINYANGKPNGLAKFFELNGNLKETGNYKNGERVGKWEYYLDGEIATEKDKKKQQSFTKQKQN